MLLTSMVEMRNWFSNYLRSIRISWRKRDWRTPLLRVCKPLSNPLQLPRIRDSQRVQWSLLPLQMICHHHLLEGSPRDQGPPTTPRADPFKAVPPRVNQSRVPPTTMTPVSNQPSTTFLPPAPKPSPHTRTVMTLRVTNKKKRRWRM